MESKKRVIDNSTDLICPICLEILTQTVITKCNHRFCGLCVEQLLMTTTKKIETCPICRNKLNDNPVPDMEMQLYL